MSWPVRAVVLALAAAVGGVLWVGIPRGLACRTSALHPHAQQVSEIVIKDQTVVQRLATGTTKGWTVDDGKAVLTADTAMRSALTPLALSKDDRAAVSAYLATVARFDTALSTYMDKDDDASHQAYSAAASDLQQDASTLSAALAGTPQRCHLS
jgi:ligand-binding sensor domain-containing protein